MRSILPVFAVALTVAVPAFALESVPVPAFRSVELRGGGEVIVRPGATQRVAILEGSSAVTRFRVERDGQLRIDVCNNNCPRNYRLRVEIQSPSSPDLAISGGGVIHAAGGFAPQAQLSAAVRGGGLIDARNVLAGTVDAAVQGGGKIAVNAKVNLQAAVQGGGEVTYVGNPAVTSAIAGGGAVRRE